MDTADTGTQTETTEPKGLDAILSSALTNFETGADTNSGEQQRNPDGTFATQSAEAAASNEPAQTEAEPAENQPADPPKQEPIAAPERWSDADKAEFAKLTPEAQTLLLARYSAMEGDYTRKTQDLAEQRKTVEPLLGEVSKWSPYLQQLGIKPEEAFSQMLTVEQNLRSGTPEQKAQALAYLANLYGAPLPSQDGSWQQPNPAATQLHQTIAGIRQELSQFKEQKAQEELERAQAEFNAVGQAKDTNGQPKYPHFERVSQTMLRLVADGQAADWDAAYTKAVRLDDELWKEQIEAERQRVAAEVEKQRREAVEKAKKAKPVHSSEGAPKGGAQLKGLDAHLTAALTQFG